MSFICQLTPLAVSLQYFMQVHTPYWTPDKYSLKIWLDLPTFPRFSSDCICLVAYSLLSSDWWEKDLNYWTKTYNWWFSASWTVHWFLFNVSLAIRATKLFLCFTFCLGFILKVECVPFSKCVHQSSLGKSKKKGKKYCMFISCLVAEKWAQRNEIQFVFDFYQALHFYLKVDLWGFIW